MKRVLVIALVIILNLVFQTTFLQYIRIRGVIPNTSVILIASYALLRGRNEGAVAGLFAGVLHDIFFGASFGYYSFLGLATGYICGIFHQNFYRENYMLPFFVCTLATIIYETLIYLSEFLLNGNLSFFYSLFNIILPEAVYTAAFSLFIYRLLFNINFYLETGERHKRRLFNRRK